MKSLIWKELHENVKWIALPTVVIVGLMALFGTLPLMDEGFLFFVSLVAAVFGAALGFVQIFFESSGDKRSLLLHRPLSRSRIFLGKTIAGIGLYLLALGIPFALVVGLAATSGHVAEPFLWPMTLPWLADALMGLVFYFAGMLTAQREARWYGSRCLGLAACLFCWYLVWTLPEFWQALVAIGIVGGLLALAAWGSFLTGGAYSLQPRVAKIALAATFLMGMSALCFTGKIFVGIWCWPRTDYDYRLDRQGRVLLVHEENGKLQSITDLAGQMSEELKGERLDRHALEEITAPMARAGWPKTRSYRNRNRSLVKYETESMPGNEIWWYVPAQGQLFGYDKQSKRLIGKFGPGGFVPPDEQPTERFKGELAHNSRLYFSRASDYLAFPDAVYQVDFRKRLIRRLFVPSAGETVLWASRWVDDKRKLFLAVVGTDQSVNIVDENGSRVFSAPRVYDRESYEIRCAGRLENPVRYWVWYEPAWYLGLETWYCRRGPLRPASWTEPAWYLGLDTLDTLAAYVVIYDSTGREISPRQEIAPRPGFAHGITPRAPPPVEAGPIHAWFGLATGPAELAFLLGAINYLVADVRESNGTQISVALQVLLVTTQYFIPGVRWNPNAHLGLVFGFAALMLMSAVVSALVCYLLARRYAFSRAQRLGWSLCGLAFGPIGLLLMLALQEWPPRVTCCSCHRPRVVTRDACEHCGAPHAAPAPDGTEIFESTATSAQSMLVERCHA
jgi:hypothetical protein